MPNDTSNLPIKRYDFATIAHWISPSSRVLDLGCGDGTLLQYLAEQKGTTGYGVENNTQKVIAAINNDINVIQVNLNQGLGQFSTQTFDTVILSMTLQAMREPKDLLNEMMRVGKYGIVTFPNFAYWKNRTQLLTSGKMPLSKQLPHYWYDTPNIHLCTIKDFHLLCAELNFKVVDSIAINPRGKKSFLLNLLPNLFGEIAIFKFTKK